MHGATIRVPNAQQAKLNNNYKNTKLKLLKINKLLNKQMHICWLTIKIFLRNAWCNNKGT